MMRYVYWCGLVLSCVGLCFSLIVHVRAYLGIGLVHWALPFGLMSILAIPWLIGQNEVTAGIDHIRQSEKWVKAYFGSWPAWMQKVTYGFLGYFLVVFVIFLFKTDGSTTWPASGPLPPRVVLFFSGGWMGFYWAFICAIWQAVHLGLRWWECPNGHRVPEERRNCQACGASPSLSPSGG